MLGKYQTLYKKDIKEVGGLIAPDEEFRKAKGIRSIYVSNYGRVISKRVGKPRLLKSHFSNGYHSIAVENGTKRKCYFVHILVAKAFVEVPDWINKDDRKEVHHIQKVDRKCERGYSDRANNLCWLPPKVHKIVDRTEEVAVKIDGQYVPMDFVRVAEYYGISPYVLAKAVGNVWKKPPTKQEDNIYYYQMPLEDGNNKVDIDIRIVRPQDEHVSRTT